MTPRCSPSSVPQQVAVQRRLRGLAFGVMAVGVILIYRSSRVINFALGELGALAAAVFVRFVVDWHWNYFAALVVMAAWRRAARRAARAGAGPAAVRGPPGGAARRHDRRRPAAPRSCSSCCPTSPATSRSPPRSRSSGRWATTIVRAEHVVALVVFPPIVAALGWFLNRTRPAWRCGRPPTTPTRPGWRASASSGCRRSCGSLAGALAVVATVLAAPLAGASSASTIDLGPAILLRTFAAAVIAGMASLPIALAAGVGIGVLEAMVFYNNPDDPGLVDVVLLVVVLVARAGGVVAPAASSASASGSRSLPGSRPVPQALRRYWLVRHHSRVGGGARPRPRRGAAVRGHRRVAPVPLRQRRCSWRSSPCR